MQRFVTQINLSLIFTKTPYYHMKQPYYLHDAYKNANGNTKFHITKLNPWKKTFWKQQIKAEDDIKVSVILASKYQVKVKNFIIPTWLFCSLSMVTTLFQHLDSFLFYTCFILFEGIFKASKKQITVNEI